MVNDVMLSVNATHDEIRVQSTLKKKKNELAVMAGISLGTRLAKMNKWLATTATLYMSWIETT